MRPAPVVTEDNEGFWVAASERRLVAQRCQQCGQLHHPPRAMCPDCHSGDLEFTELAGTGVVYSYALLHHPQNPLFEYPIPAALIDLDEGVRLMSTVVGVDPHEIRIGMEVEVDFEPATGDMMVPVFRPRGGVQ
jgi:uncharacterized OB-fold protein